MSENRDLISRRGTLALGGTLAGSLAAAGATLKIVAPKVGGAKGSNGQMIPADFQLAGGPSVLFDSVAVALSQEGAQASPPGRTRGTLIYDVTA